MITCVGAKQVVCIQDVLEISRWDVIELSRPDMEKNYLHGTSVHVEVSVKWSSEPSS